MEKILIVIDMQNDFISGALGSKEAYAIVDNVVEKINSYPWDKVCFSRDTHTSDYMNTQEGRNLPIMHCIEGTDGWQLCDKVKGVMHSDSVVINKSAFGSMQLVRIIEKCIKPDTEIEIVGLCTDICVVANAMLIKCMFPENEITVDASCCAGVTQESHNAALMTMRMCQIKTTNC